MLKFLTFDPRTIPEEGITICGEITFTELDIPQSDRMEPAEALSLEITVHPVQGAVLAQGRAETVLRCRCDRCLTYFDYQLLVKNICHYYKLEEVEHVDLTNDVREDILLSLPQQRILCQEDCRGLCQLCGQNLNVRECGCDLSVNLGSEWDKLDELSRILHQN
ncbi:MAG: YceD family protein [Verrucomicrobiota bacterium]